MDLTDWFGTVGDALVERLPHAPVVARAIRSHREAFHAVHLAVLVEPFMEFVLSGSKTVESRFSTTRVAPYRAVKERDPILLKAAAGPVVGAAIARHVWYFHSLCQQTRAELHVRFGAALRDDVPGFWEDRQEARYATLIQLDEVTTLTAPLACPKADRRGWVVLHGRANQLGLFT